MSRFGLVASIVLACGVLTGAAAGGSAAARVGHSSGSAVEVPGSVTLNGGGGYGSVSSISCPAAGECAAGGYYSSGGGGRPFVVSETNGSWGNAIKVPGPPALKSNGRGSVNSISCAAPGDCAAGGYYRDQSGGQAFVVSETNGIWGNAIEVPRTATLNTGGDAYVSSISCVAAGDCVAGGAYTHAPHDPGGDNYYHAFVVSETNGIWGNAINVPGMARLNLNTGAEVDSISCAAAGECAAGGGYYCCGDRYAFVVGETNGSWGNAIEVPGTPTDTDVSSYVESISCAAAGECVAGGTYSHDSNHYQAFVVSETNGSWGHAIKVPGTATLNTGGVAEVRSVSCGAAGDCSAGGSYSTIKHQQAFVITETNGSWGHAIKVPGTATLNTGGDASVNSISCAAAGDCAAGGYYTTGSNHQHALVVTETNGSWGNAIGVPGTTSPNCRHCYVPGVYSTSCAAAGECAAGGFYNIGSSGRRRAFVVSETNGSWGNTIQLRNFPASCVVPNVVGKAISGAKNRLNAAGCGPGKITKAYSNLPKGRVVAQKPKPGKILSFGARVALTVSKGTKT